MYIAAVPNRGSRPTIIIREGYRENGKVKNRTIANITHLPQEQIEALRLVFKGKRIAEVDQLFEKLESKLHGHVHAVLSVVGKLGVDKLISFKPCHERDVIIAVIVARICQPDSKLAMTRWWKDTTLPELLNIQGVTEDDIYEAMDWLFSAGGPRRGGAGGPTGAEVSDASRRSWPSGTSERATWFCTT